MPTLTILLREAQIALAATSTTPRLDAELILAHLLAWPRARLIAERDQHVDETLATHFTELIARRATGEPVAYLIGYKEFYGLDFSVDQRVLVPRPETELLVELALALAAKRDQPLRLADIGTGSGAIAVALAVHLPSAQLDAVDISPAALAVARNNIDRHGLNERIRLLQGDLLTPLVGRYDLIVSNPPYTILADVAANVFAHEPHLALAGGSDGADLYRRIFAQAPAYLQPAGALLCEIGAWQGDIVSTLARAAFPHATISLSRDLAGHERVISVILPT